MRNPLKRHTHYQSNMTIMIFEVSHYHYKTSFISILSQKWYPWNFELTARDVNDVLDIVTK